MTPLKLSTADRLSELLEEAERELQEIQPRIDEIESLWSELQDLKKSKQRLITLKLSLNAMLNTEAKDEVQSARVSAILHEMAESSETEVQSFDVLSTSKTFYPDRAFEQVDQVLKQKQSLNYQIFQAIVFQGGKATTEAIKSYLVEIGAKQPQSQKSFDDVPLTDISSRANYLVRKGLIHPTQRGSFYTHLGWQ